METKGNINFVLVGARATGKTVYLASLYLHSKCITAKDVKSIEYLKPLADTLGKGTYPSATSGSLYEMKFNYKDKNFNSDIQIDDVDGYFIETLSQEDKHTQVERDTFIRNVELSEGIIFFFPYQELFDEERIKEFNYQIDTIVSKLKKIYIKRDSIPIPTVIALSKWDDSPYYKSSEEDEKVVEYIESKKFLRLAKEKIESNFSQLKLIPISATGPNMNQLEPYNIEKPLEFFLKKTYANWIKKIESLNEDKEAQLIFLSKIHFDMRLYAKYDKLYHSLEQEYSAKLFKELENVKTLKAYRAFEKKNIKLINALLSENKNKFLDIEKNLTSKRRVKRVSSSFIVVLVITLLVLGTLAWNEKTFLIKNETELFSDIETQFKTNNYDDALDNIRDYQRTYSDTINLKHKSRVIEIKSIIEKNQIVMKAKQIVNDATFNNISKIEEILTLFLEMGIDKPVLQKALSKRKKELIIEEEYRTFKDTIENSNFTDAITHIEMHFKEAYSKDSYSSIQKALDTKFNHEVEKLLKSISNITDIDEYNNLRQKRKKISELQKNNEVKKINYIPSFFSENKTEIDEKKKLEKSYTDVLLKDGVKNIKVSFGAIREENEPLGFKCGGEDEIILQIETQIYHFDKSISCNNRKISFEISTQIFKKGRYSVKVIEEDLTDNDHYDNGSFSLTDNDLIKLHNGNEVIKKDIGSGYFVELEGR